MTNAPESDKIHESQPLYGKHQPGIVTPRPAAGLVASFDVLARDRAELERMFKLLTERAEFLMKGGEPPELDAKFPPSDSVFLDLSSRRITSRLLWRSAHHCSMIVSV